MTLDGQELKADLILRRDRIEGPDFHVRDERWWWAVRESNAEPSD